MKLHNNPLTCLARKDFGARTGKGIFHSIILPFWRSGGSVVRVERHTKVIPLLKSLGGAEQDAAASKREGSPLPLAKTSTYCATEVAIILSQA